MSSMTHTPMRGEDCTSSEPCDTREPYTWERGVDKTREAAAGAGEESTRRLNDPIRMYFSQTKTFPLLDRDEEVSLGQALESAKSDFRERLYSLHPCVERAVQILELVSTQGVSIESVLDVDLSKKGARKMFFVHLAKDVAALKRKLAANTRDRGQLASDRSREDRSRVERRLKRRTADTVETLSRYAIKVHTLAGWLESLTTTSSGDDSFAAQLAEAKSAFRRYENAKAALACGNLRCGS